MIPFRAHEHHAWTGARALKKNDARCPRIWAGQYGREHVLYTRSFCPSNQPHTSRIADGNDRTGGIWWLLVYGYVGVWERDELLVQWGRSGCGWQGKRAEKRSRIIWMDQGQAGPKLFFWRRAERAIVRIKNKNINETSSNRSQTVLASCFGPPSLAAADCCRTPPLSLCPAADPAVLLCFGSFRSLWLLSPIRYRIECFLMRGCVGRRRRAAYAHRGHHTRPLSFPRPQVAFTRHSAAASSKLLHTMRKTNRQLPCCLLLNPAPLI